MAHRTVLLVLSCQLILLVNVTAAFEPTRLECLAPAKKGGGMALSCHLLANALLKTDLISEKMSIQYKSGGIGAVAYNHVVGVRNNDPGLVVAASSGSALNIATGKFGHYGANAVRWLGALGADHGVIAVRPEAPWTTLEELLETLRENPEHIVFGGGGSIGSQDWMKIALLVRQAEINPRLIRFASFEGGGEALLSFFSGQIDVFSGDASEIHHIPQDKIRILAVLSDERLPGNLAVSPTAKEQGFDVIWTVWRGFYMGPKVSNEAYNWWVATLRRLLNTNEFKQERERLGMYPFGLVGREFGQFVRDNVTKQRQLAKDIGLLHE